MLSAGILKRLADASPKLVAETDLMAGTSVGASIISCLLADLTPTEVYGYFRTRVPGFFKVPNADPQRPAFDVNSLAAAQHELHPTNPDLDAVKKKVLFTSFNVGASNTNWGPVLFNNLSKSTTGTTPLIDAVVSSGAMPGELGSYKGNIDGAFVNHDPTLPAIALALNEGVRLENIVAICIGTGFMANWIASDTSQWGAAQWELGDGNPANRTPPTLINGTTSPVLNAAIDGTSTNLVPDLVAMMLPGRYTYVNPTLDRIVPEDDTNAADLAYLQAQAQQADISAATTLLKKYWHQ
jgi:patatin-like phospholipase/acyl hydrolase